MRRRTQLFIAYLYKPEAQAKVFQMPVLHSPIIPSLALQAYKARKVVGKSPIRETKRSAADFFGFETKFLQLNDDAFPLIALDFDFTIFHCSPGATL